jgi:hypothetical protein
MDKYQKQLLIKSIDDFLEDENEMCKTMGTSYTLGYAIGILKIIKEELSQTK